MLQAMTLSESLGDYLESIYHLVRANRVARVKEIAERMRVQMPSVTGALRALAEKELVDYGPYRLVTLTPKGERAARELVRRHELLTEFFRDVLGLDNDSAARNACRMEHAIEPEAMGRLVSFLETKRPHA